MLTYKNYTDWKDVLENEGKEKADEFDQKLRNDHDLLMEIQDATIKMLAKIDDKLFGGRRGN